MRKEKEGLGSEDREVAEPLCVQAPGDTAGLGLHSLSMLEKFVKLERVCVPITERGGGRNIATRVIRSSFIC